MDGNAVRSSIAAALVALTASACSSEPSGMQQNNALPGGTGATFPPLAGTSAAGTGGTAAPAGSGGVAGSFVAPAGSGGTAAPAGAGGMAAAGTGGEPDPGGTGGTAADAGGTPSPSPATLPPVDSLDEDGPFTVTIDEAGGENSWVFHPTELGQDGIEHPIFVWGTGATSVPSQYTDHFTRMASHGFVIISPNTGQVNAMRLKASLDWILAENARDGSVYYQKLDPEKIAMGGHSLGSVSTFNQEAMEDRLTTTIHIAGGSFDGLGSSKVKTPTAYICGAAGDIALPQCQVDFENAMQPTFYSELQGVGHVDAARAALPGMIAWLRWHLAGETDRRAMFTGPDGEFFQGIWSSQTKNW